jgi:hypothetical protein
MIKDFVPARTSLASGVVIKQHLLERNKYPQPLVEWENVTYSGSIKSQWLWSDIISGSYVSSSLIETFNGGTGGTFNSYNFTGSTFPKTFINNTQSWADPTKTPVGLINISQSDQKEFYNGELPYSEIVATDGELNEANTFKYPSTYQILYNPTLYISNITNEIIFTNPATSPNNGEIYLWWDSGSLTNPGNTRTVVPTNQLIKTLGGTAAEFFVNKTNGVKYIKVNRYDTNGINQSDYLGQLETITLVYPDRIAPIIYNIAGTQEFNDYYFYSIGPYVPGSMTNFNTSSVGDINNYSLLASKTSVSIPDGGVTTVSGYTPTTNPNGYFTASSGLYTWYQTPNPYLTFEFTASGVSMPSSFAPDNTFQLVNGSNIIFNQGFIADGTPRNYSGSFILQPIETQQYGFAIFHDADSGTPALNITTLTIKIIQTTPEFNGSSSLTLFDPYVPNFDYNNYNPLLNNAVENQTSQFFMKLDYDQSPVIPSNLTIILNNSAPRAQIQDSNYDSRAYSNIRYNGSRTNSYRIINQ